MNTFEDITESTECQPYSFIIFSGIMMTYTDSKWLIFHRSYKAEISLNIYNPCTQSTLNLNLYDWVHKISSLWYRWNKCLYIMYNNHHVSVHIGIYVVSMMFDSRVDNVLKQDILWHCVLCNIVETNIITSKTIKSTFNNINTLFISTSSNDWFNS